MKVATAVELHVRGVDESQSLEQTIYEGQVVRIGRAPANGWTIPWDPMISREHADACWDGEHLRVVCLDAARNSIVAGDQSLRSVDVKIGQQFRIGTSTFSLVESEAYVSKMETIDLEFETETASGGMEQAYSAEELGQVSFGDTERQMEILANLPRMISSSQSDKELASLLATLLLDAISGAECVAVTQFDTDEIPMAAGESAESLPKPLMLQVDTRDDFTGRFRPSRRLLLRTLQQQESLIHIWSGDEGGSNFTLSDGLGWAFCTPIRGESCHGWCLYVSGKTSDFAVGDEALKGDLRFTELVAQFIGSVRQVRLLQEHKTQLSTFFSPKVIENLTGRDAGDALKPGERDVSVLFCDVRGFSRKSEAMADDLHALLDSVRAALGVMSSGILDYDGTIADFQGDAALGFWGWPGELAEGPIPACRAALAICRGFLAGNQDETSLLHGFSIGIGIVHGRAIAGQIGTASQAKVGVFGPVVNQGSRLEGLTRQFGVHICIDATTADWVQRLLPANEARLRRLARVRPKGMESPLDVYQLLPPASPDDELTDDALAIYEAALEAVDDGRWDDVRVVLGQVPDSDGGKRFLLHRMAATGNRPPTGWDGAFKLDSK